MYIPTIIFGSGILFAIIIIIGTGISNDNFASAAKTSCPPHVIKEQCQPINSVDNVIGDKSRDRVNPKVGNDVIKTASATFLRPQENLTKTIL